MAVSTPWVLTAGGLVFADRIVAGDGPDVRVAVATGAAALITAGIDKAAPGMGRGLAILLCLGAVLTAAPRLVRALPGGATLPGVGVGGRLGPP